MLASNAAAMCHSLIGNGLHNSGTSWQLKSRVFPKRATFSSMPLDSVYPREGWPSIVTAVP